MTRAPGRLVVGNFNLHAGIDGWGRPFDVVAACRGINVDVLVLEEVWSPAGGTSQAETVGAALGYEVHQYVLAEGRRAGPHPRASAHWMRPLDWRGAAHAIYLDSERPLSDRVTRTERFHSAEPGGWGIAVLSRRPVVRHGLVDLGHLRRDRSRRAALVVEVDVGTPDGGGPDGGGPTLTVVGTHMTHLSYGSPLHYVQLARRLDGEIGDRAAVLVGDMNLWGPPVSAMLRGWQRTRLGKTWPAWRPHSQVDHILVRGPVRVLSGEVLPMAGSDHRPVRATLAVG